ncbi:HlyD family secretion protein [Thermomonas flagellata]|uniref:HlyD family secretion protein n=1 Tax=Thermomonas flagellata TaxID=2888524 RepID=UPI001F03BC11|nr:HlyD family efflux transporter periplasmic adaptor subunit [Thermomonas flagellata]
MDRPHGQSPARLRPAALRWGLPLGLLAFLGLGIGVWRQHAALPDGVVLATVVRGDLEETVEGQGEFVSDEQRLITAPVAGRVERLAISPGSRLAPGESLLQLAVPALLEERDRARLDLQRTEFGSAQRLGENAKAVEAARLREREARIALKTAQVERDAMQQLLADKIVSRLQYAQAQARVDQAQAAADAARRLAAMEQQAFARQQRLGQDDLSLARVHLHQLDAKIAAADVRAPAAGVVKRVMVKLGDSVSEGAPLLEIGPLLPNMVRVMVPQRALDRLAVGQPALIRMPDGQQVPGRVAGIAPDAVEGLVAVRVRPLRMPAQARNGLAVQAEIVLGRLRQVLFVPSDLDPLDSGPSRVFWERDGRLQTLKLAGLRRIGRVLVLPPETPIRAGDRVALAPDEMDPAP